MFVELFFAVLLGSLAARAIERILSAAILAYAQYVKTKSMKNE